MLGGREAEAEVVVAVIGVVVVPITRRAVPGVVVPAAAPVSRGSSCRPDVSPHTFKGLSVSPPSMRVNPPVR